MHSRYQRPYVIWLLALGPHLTVSGSVGAQDTLYVTGDTPSCRECFITFERIAELGDRRGDGIIPGYPAGAARDGQGNFWLTFHSGGEVPSVFDSSGSFVRTIGREGGGPGEFAGGGLMRLSSSSTDSIYVFDAGNMRVSVFSGPDRWPVRMSPVRGVWGEWFLVLEDGTTVVNNASRREPLAGSTLHLYGVDGDHVRSFGGESAGSSSGERMIRSRRYLSRSIEPNRIWSLSTSYVAELWETNGKKHRTLIRQAEWFTPYREFRGPSPDRMPAPLPTHIYQDANGLLWVAVVVGDPNWAQALGPGRKELGEEYRIQNENQYRDTRIEVINPKSGELLTSATVGVQANFMLGSEYLISLSDDFQDDPKLHVWRVRLRGSGN